MNPPADPQTPLDTASQLAASGNPTAALRILDSLGEDVPAAHLLRAKILAQKEQYSASLPFWRKALGANSAHEETWAGYEESVVRSRRRPLPGFLRPSGLLLSLTALCVLLAVALAWTSSRWSPPPSPPIACPPDPPLRNEFRDLIARVESIHDEVAALAKAKPEPVPPPAPPASDTVVQRETARLAEFVAGLRRDVSDLSSRVSSSTPPAAPAPLPPAKAPLRLSLPPECKGVTCREQPGGSVLLVFDEGLFLRNATLRPGGRDLLVNLARHLAAEAPPCQWKVTGFSDSASFAADGDHIALGFSRAQVVADTVRASIPLPPQRISVSSAGQTNPPFPDPGELRGRNRTATILLESAE